MENPGGWKGRICSVLLSGFVLMDVLGGGLAELPCRGDFPGKQVRFSIDHIRVETSKSFQEVATAFEKQLGKFDAEVLHKAVADSGAIETRKAKIAAMAGPSGFMLFGKQDHGELLRLAGQKRKAIQYIVGNPLFALQMTSHDIRAGLYAPLRVLLFENEAGKTCLEYDKPSSLFGQFGNAEILAVATMLDRKLESLIKLAVEP